MNTVNESTFTSLTEALGCLVINGFIVDYDDNEYGETVSVKSTEGFVSLGYFDYEKTTPSELVSLAKGAIEYKEKPRELTGSSPTTIEELLNML